MTANPRPIVFTEVEIRSQLPSGWRIAAGAPGRWDAGTGSWSVEVHDGADNRWTVSVTAARSEKSGRVGALAEAIRQLERKALGRKSVISG
jgi:hypothetical protein